MSANGEPKTLWIAVAGIVGAVVVFALIVLLVTLFYNLQDAEVREKVYSQVPQELSRLRSRQLEQLAGPEWVYATFGQVVPHVVLPPALPALHLELYERHAALTVESP